MKVNSPAIYREVTNASKISSPARDDRNKTPEMDLSFVPDETRNVLFTVSPR
jgi:hypothetical protein